MKLARKNDEAVSLVIGVILMVAITVILAAVIAAFVFGVAGSIHKANPQGYVTCSDYYHIVDKYKSPSGFYVTVVQPNGVTYTTSVSESDYPTFQINGYGGSKGWGIFPLNITRVNESESGYRDACRLLP